jgi:hypothetical protein
VGAGGGSVGAAEVLERLLKTSATAITTHAPTRSVTMKIRHS